MKSSYIEQLKIPDENWANEVKRLRSTYQITETDAEIATVPKSEWKDKIANTIKTEVIRSLNEEKNNLSKSSVFPDAVTLQPSKYLYHFTVNHACLLFRVRCRIADIKDLQRYKYGSDQGCRCCDVDAEETLDHVLSECPGLCSQQCSSGDEYSEDMLVLERVVTRIQEFTDKVDKADEEAEEE